MYKMVLVVCLLRLEALCSLEAAEDWSPVSCSGVELGLLALPVVGSAESPAVS